ncbi:Cof-type HAD-IIB family hydrolase [Streptococcus sp. DD12]|uniref:Cof-type HAD-IIB family hydrolase n=1 Tax=Streptococcus sp. DD12 TaxID=1777880 RepID=UPI0007940C58|nr:Cof-type HAD-IIB family hydrolase [Streptococcus sp. DD12]KXT75690.1 Hydrolase, haloacid dehalogenase-like family [Streptococcus sp. DD12]
MAQAKVQLIISDIDGTILNDQHQVDSQLRDEMPYLAQARVPFVLASARSPQGMAPIAHDLGLSQQPLACYNGALVITGEPNNYQTILQHPIDPTECQSLIALLRKQFPKVSINLYAGSRWIIEKKNKWSDGEAQITGEKPHIQSFSSFFAQKEACHKLLLIAKPSLIQELLRTLESQTFHKIAFYLSKDNYLEVTAKHVSKENALMELANYYQTPLEQVMTIGDNYNDIPMLKMAGLGIAMGNAPQDVKKHAKIVTKTNNDHGVAHAVEDYVLI